MNDFIITIMKDSINKNKRKYYVFIIIMKDCMYNKIIILINGLYL